MRLPTLLLLSCLFAGCNAVEPMRGHFTQNLSQEQMTATLEQHLKPGMPLDEAQLFMKNEEFTYIHSKEHTPGVQTIRFTRRDQLEFWVEQLWTVTLEASQGKLIKYTVKSETARQ